MGIKKTITVRTLEEKRAIGRLLGVQARQKKATDRKENLMTAFYSLGGGQAVNLQDMASHFHVTERTIRRDVEECGELAIKKSRIFLKTDGEAGQ